VQRRTLFLTTFSIILLVDILLCGLVLATHAGDPLVFAHIGSRFSSRGTAEDAALLSANPTGYDGQFVYYIARDGFASEPLLDGPSFRFQRILLPLFGGLLSLGKASLVPWTLLLVNIIGHAVGAGLMALLLKDYDAPALLGGLTYGLWIGILFALRLTLTEILCFGFGLAALLACRQNKLLLTVLLLVCSILSKEIGVVFAAGIALHLASQRQWRWAAVNLFTPIAVLGLWWLILRLRFGDLPTQYIAARQVNFFPYGGLISSDNDIIETVMLLLWVAIPNLILLALALRAGWQWWQQRHNQSMTLATALMLMCGGFVLTIPAVTWSDPAAAYRVAMPTVIGGLLFLGQHHRRLLRYFAILWLFALCILLLLPGLWIG
jgi:hypothetical protein